MKIKPSQVDEPGARLYLLGESALTEAENLSIIIAGKGALEKAKKIMVRVNHQYSELAKLTYHDMLEEGLTHTQCLHILACNNYSHRKASQTAALRDKIACSKDVAEIFYPVLSDLNHEEFWILFLNRANVVLGKEKHTQGGSTGTVTDVQEIVRRALAIRAQGIIMVHNHPSGNLNPSESDRIITKKIKEAAALLDIQLMDALVIGGSDYYSFADNGLL